MAPKSIYPFKGIIYFISTPSLWPRVILPFIVLLVITIALLVLAFMYLMPIQVDFFIDHNWYPWVAKAVAGLLTLLEAALGSLISYLALMPFWEDALFDAVLRSERLGYIIDAAHGDYRTCLNGVLGGLYIIAFQSVVLLLFQVVSLIVLLPLHAIPVIGTVVYCYLNGWVMTFSKRIHYDVELCKKSVNQSRKYAWKNRGDFCEFGAAAVFLEMIPVLNLLFFWTNVVGAALWVADEIEADRRRERIANRLAPGQEQGSHYVTFHPYDSSRPGLPTEPLLQSHDYGSYGGHPQQQQQIQQQQYQQYQYQQQQQQQQQ
ncbi:hypothetical protein BG011_007395 [Mortierella polycephala]|uniref:Uncharacterized protein n=1 Tax=Mortierella polycephala TaxID=41804 RepID=A0A9P6TYB2_9FUNG|nr:hypothetical protein BG011_007395 [Mortierella polycephala]